MEQMQHTGYLVAYLYKFFLSMPIEKSVLALVDIERHNSYRDQKTKYKFKDMEGHTLRQPATISSTQRSSFSRHASGIRAQIW